MKIGLTGTIAAGKSTVSSYLASRGFYVINVDKVGHWVLQDPDICAMLIADFGEDVADNGIINRPALARKAFSSAESVTRLNEITHPAIRHRVTEEASTKDCVVIDAALLFELDLNNICDVCWFIDAPESVRRERLGIEKESFLKREQYQEPYQPKRDRCQSIVVNEGTSEQLHKKIELLLQN